MLCKFPANKNVQRECCVNIQIIQMFQNVSFLMQTFHLIILQTLLERYFWMFSEHSKNNKHLKRKH